MKGLILDTNIISTFLRTDLLHLINAVFPNHAVIIPEAVLSELKRANFENLSIRCESIRPEEKRILVRISREYNNLGMGELECIAIAVNRQYPMLTNDRKAQKAAIDEGVKCWNLPELLRAALLKKVVTGKELRIIVERIEEKDDILFKNKEYIYR